MPAITTTEQDVYPPRVLVSVTGLTVGDDVEIFRSVAGARTAVRAGTFAGVTDTAVLALDAELPFGVPVTWVAVVNGVDEYTAGPATYTLPGGKVALSDAISGAAAEVVVLSWPERARRRQSSVFPVGGRSVVVAGELGGFESTIELVATAYSSVQQVLSLLEVATQAIVQLRQPGGYDGVDCYVAVLGVTERRWSQDGTDERRVLVLQVVETDPWADGLEAQGYSYADLDGVYTGLTYADLAVDFGSYLELAQADLGA